MAGILEWISVILGTPLGAIMLLMSGAGKLLPFHPMNKAMSYGFDNVFGPFLGCPGMPLRIFIGLGELIGGLCLLIGLWGDALGAFDKKMSDVVKALVIADGVALFIVMTTAALMHKYIDGKMGMQAGLSGLALFVTLIRMFFVGPDHFANQMIATILSCLIMLGAVVTLLINRSRGQHESTVEQENKQLQEMMNGK